MKPQETKAVSDPAAVKLSLAQKIGYGMGEAGSTLSFTMIGSYLTVFYSDVVGLAPAVISVIMLIARICVKSDATVEAPAGDAGSNQKAAQEEIDRAVGIFLERLSGGRHAK